MNSSSANRQYEQQQQQNSSTGRNQNKNASAQSNRSQDSQQSEQLSSISGNQTSRSQAQAQSVVSAQQPTTSSQMTSSGSEKRQHQQHHLGSHLQRKRRIWKRQAPPLSQPPSTTTATSISTPTASLLPVSTEPPERPLIKPALLTDQEFAELWDVQPDKLRLGILLPLNAPMHERQGRLARRGLSAIKLAVKHTNERNIIPGVQMALLVRDSQVPNVYTTEGGAAIAAAGRLVTHKVGGVIGDLRSDLTRYEALMTSSVKVPHCSYASVGTILSDSSIFPYFFRTIPTTIALLDAIMDVIEYFGWHRISILYDGDSLGWPAREYFASRARSKNIHILSLIPLTVASQPYDPQFKVALDKVKSVDSRIQILMASGNLQKDVLYAARDVGMMAAEYAWITINDISDVFQNATARRDFDGTIMVDNAWDLSGYAPYDDFRDEWMRLNTTEYPGAGDPILHNNEAMAYSCAMMIAHGYGQYMRKKGMLPGGQINEAVRSAIIQGDLTKEIHMNDYFSKTTYMSPSGPITLDVNGDRENGNYVALSLQDGYASTFGVIATSNSSKYTKPFFKDGSTIPPRDAPPWAIQNPTWNNTGGIIFGIISILLIAMVLVTMCVVIRFRHHIVIKASSPTFCICELLGILFVAIWCLLYVGIPNEASCIAQMFLVPVGATLLVGSLTVKNYRIYRIFNSVGFSNEAIQTRLLMRYVFVSVALCLIPVILHVILDRPIPITLNIRQYQWIQCQSAMRIPWFVGSLVLPFILVLFGVYLAFRTRNVVFLWNEARQIALVLYNAFFFAVIILISQYFPYEIYPATFYVSLAGTIFTSSMALCILFLPKFWEMWKHRHKLPWEFSIGHPMSNGGHGGNPRTFRIGGMARGIFADFGHFHSGGGGGGGGGGRRRGGGDGGMVDSRSIDGIQLSGRKNSLVNWTNGFIRRYSPHQLPPPGTPPPSPFIANADQAEEQSNDQKEQQSLPSLPPPLQQEQRRSQSSEDARENVFRARVARRPNMIAAVSGGVTIKEEEEEPRGRTERELFLIRMQSCSHNDLNVVQESADSIMQGSDGNHGGPIASETAPGRESGAHRMLESFVFLLPIMSQRSRLSNFLSHWAMATIILIPEAHAFLAIDSTTGKSRSVLMKSMVPIYDEREPTLRVEMVRSGLLLLRFPSVARLKGWLGLFTQQDLHILCAIKEHEETQWSSRNPVPYESDATVTAGGGGSINSRSMGTGRPISMATSGFPSQERHSLDALHGGRDGLTKVEADTLEDQMAGFNFQPVGRESTSSRSTSFASRLGSSISSGASRLWSTRKNSAGSFWGSWSSRRTNSHDATNTITHRATELLSDKGIGPLDPHGTPSWMLSGESNMYGDNNKEAAKAGAHSPPDRPAASTSAPSLRLSELHCASKTVKLSSPPVAVQEVEEDVCSVDVNLQKASHKGKETANYSDQADCVAETSHEPVLRCAQGTDAATKCHQSSSALTKNSPSIPTTLASSTIVPSPASPGTTGEAMRTDVSTHSTLVSPTPARIVTPFLGCGSGGVTPDMSNASASSTAPPSRIPSPLAAVLDGRPHLVEVLSAMGITGDMDDYGHSDDDLYDPEFGIGPTSGKRRRRRRSQHSGSISSCRSIGYNRDMRNAISLTVLPARGGGGGRERGGSSRQSTCSTLTALDAFTNITNNG